MSTSRFMLVPAAYVLLRRGPGTADATGEGTGDGSGEGVGGGPGEVLLQLRQNTGYMDGHWAVAAAGHVEAGESAFEAAVREAREELGIEVAAEDLEPVTAMHRTNGGPEPIEQRVDLFFQCRRWTGEPQRIEPHKNADLRWFPLDALPDATVPHERRLFDLLAQGRPVPRLLTFGFPTS